MSAGGGVWLGATLELHDGLLSCIWARPLCTKLALCTLLTGGACLEFDGGDCGCCGIRSLGGAQGSVLWSVACCIGILLRSGGVSSSFGNDTAFGVA